MNKKRLLELCEELKYHAFSQELERQFQLTTYDDMPFIERLEALLLSQLDDNKTRARMRMKKQAQLRWPDACLADSLKMHQEVRPLLAEVLMEFDWVNGKENVIITGKTGTGKTHLACAISNGAIESGITVKFKRFYDLLLELVAAENEQTLNRFRAKLNRVKILVLDDWGLAPLSERERHLLFEFIESRECQASLIITSQYDVSDWHSAFQDQTLADSVLDRIVSYAHVIRLEGDSARQRKGGRHE
ncbi:IS21-like element helper ATPase IstB [Pseudoalteromonas sp. PPB1]|uniref:IS21-like element helper ATPase IstB n=1 Tax=Pseudoalteromonas sp. PPB1 TaxID=2756136 RepID=UPI001891CDEA|nr:IS21-like element helper ATPase IstB [Pseudoalteromonas sp. PPB1]